MKKSTLLLLLSFAFAKAQVNVSEKLFLESPAAATSADVIVGLNANGELSVTTIPVDDLRDLDWESVTGDFPIGLDGAIRREGQVFIGTPNVNVLRSLLTVRTPNSDERSNLAKFVHRSTTAEAEAMIQIGSVADDVSTVNLVARTRPAVNSDSYFFIETNKPLSAGVNTYSFDPDGNFGVGIEFPTERVDVDGNVQSNGYKINGQTDDDVVLAGGGHIPLATISGSGVMGGLIEEVANVVDGVLLGFSRVGVIPEDVTEIAPSVFANQMLDAITLPDGLEIIGLAAFNNNVLTTVTLPDTLTRIGNAAFLNNNLTSIVIPNGITSIGTSTFQSNQLTSVTLPNALTILGSNAFLGNLLSNIILPETLISIGSGVFRNNVLESIIIPDSVTEIGDNAFRNNDLTGVIIIPDSVTSINNFAFLGNPNITSLSVLTGTTLGTDVVDAGITITFR